jgi:predicted site-specific integrase-resolvase
MSQPVTMKEPAMPLLVNTRQAAQILGRSAATLKRWRAEGVGPNWIELQGRVSYDVNVLLDYIHKNTRVASVRAAMEETREAV